MISTQTNNSTITILLDKRFDSSVSQEFTSHFKQHPNHSHFIIDLSKTDYMDSGALGAMIALYHYVGPKGNKITIKGAQEEVLSILKLSNFKQLFAIE